MISAIESITCAVRDLDAARRLAQEELGLEALGEAHASVALLSAWRHPVHESVRLVEFGHAASPFGRIRLACFEDARIEGTGLWDAPPSPVPAAGAVALDLRSDIEPDARAVWNPGGPAFFLPSKPATKRRSATHPALAPVGAVWILATELESASRFYVDALGYVPGKPLGELTERASPGIAGTLALHTSERIDLRHLHSVHEPRGGVVLVRGAQAARPALSPRPRLGHPGINLLSCRCDDLDGLARRLRALDMEPLTPAMHVSIPGGQPGRVLVVRGPSGELIEFTDLTD